MNVLPLREHRNDWLCRTFEVASIESMRDDDFAMAAPFARVREAAS